MTVLIRPEQIDIVPNEDGLTAHVTSYRYHGHDAVLHVRPEEGTGPSRSWSASSADRTGQTARSSRSAPR